MIEDDLFEPIPSEEKPKRNIVKLLMVFFSVIVLLLLTAVTYLIHLNQPNEFAAPITIVVEEGESVSEITEKFEKTDVVKSGDLLYMILVSSFDSTQIKASQYVIEKPLSTYDVAARLMAGDFDSDLQSITIFEGESRKKIATRLSKQFSWFDIDEFLLLTTELEGQLFPDTYFIPKDYSTDKLVNLLKTTYDDLINEYKNEFAVSDFSEDEIITLASIVEREANTEQSMKLVAGIFINRLEIGMALQADASIEYVIDEGLSDLPPGALAESLREIDSPYNTYKYPGLPPTPIGNPGRAAIEAVLRPTTSDYFYYITGTNGDFYYAETYNEHLRNISRHLR